MNETTKSRLVAITGGSGAGKSWLADQLHHLLGEKAGRLSLENFYLDRSHLPPSRRALLNLDQPEAVEWPLFEGALQDCLAGRPLQMPRYDFRTHCRLPANGTRHPRAVMLVDGLWLLHRPALRRLFQLRVFLECPAKTRLRRRLAREAAERGHGPAASRRPFRATMHRHHVAPQVRWAEVILHQPYTEADIQLLHTALWRLLEGGSLLPAWMRETFRAELALLLRRKETS